MKHVIAKIEELYRANEISTDVYEQLIKSTQPVVVEYKVQHSMTKDEQIAISVKFLTLYGVGDDAIIGNLSKSYEVEPQVIKNALVKARVELGQELGVNQ